MGGCGQIVLDANGYSRGGAVTGGIMHDLWNDREVRALLETDACVGATYVDAIDRTQEDRTFPWRLPGHIVNDPYVRRRGNEKITNYYCANWLPETGETALIGGISLASQLLFPWTIDPNL